MSKKKLRFNPEQTEQLSSPLTKELLEEIRRNFEKEIKESGEMSGKLRNFVVDTHERIIEETVETFIQHLLTTVVNEWTEDKNRRTNTGRRRTDGMV